MPKTNHLLKVVITSYLKGKGINLPSCHSLQCGEDGVSICCPASQSPAYQDALKELGLTLVDWFMGVDSPMVQWLYFDEAENEQPA